MRQIGRRRQIHWAMAAPHCLFIIDNLFIPLGRVHFRALFWLARSSSRHSQLRTGDEGRRGGRWRPPARRRTPPTQSRWRNFCVRARGHLICWSSSVELKHWRSDPRDLRMRQCSREQATQISKGKWPFSASYSLLSFFSRVSGKFVPLKIFRWLDSNCGPLPALYMNVLPS